MQRDEAERLAALARAPPRRRGNGPPRQRQRRQRNGHQAVNAQAEARQAQRIGLPRRKQGGQIHLPHAEELAFQPGQVSFGHLAPSELPPGGEMLRGAPEMPFRPLQARLGAVPRLRKLPAALEVKQAVDEPRVPRAAEGHAVGGRSIRVAAHGPVAQVAVQRRPTERRTGPDIERDAGVGLRRRAERRQRRVPQKLGPVGEAAGPEAGGQRGQQPGGPRQISSSRDRSGSRTKSSSPTMAYPVDASAMRWRRSDRVSATPTSSPPRSKASQHRTTGGRPPATGEAANRSACEVSSNAVVDQASMGASDRLRRGSAVSVTAMRRAGIRPCDGGDERDGRSPNRAYRGES